MAALKPADRRSKQEGVIGVETPSAKYTCRFASQGTQSGERVVLQFEGKKLAFKSLEDLGMRAKMQEQLDQILQPEILTQPRVFGTATTTAETHPLSVRRDQTD